VSHIRIRSLALRVIVVLVLCIVHALPSYAQTSVKRYTQVNGVFIPFTAYIAPKAPSTFTASFVFPYGAALNWNETLDTTHYQLEHKAPNSSEWVIDYSGGETNYSLTDLEIGQNSFRVVSCGGNLCGLPTAVRSIVVGVPDDSDSDGVFDFEDVCAGTINTDPVDSRGCSLKQLDSDGDGVNDAIDQCPASTLIPDAQGCDAAQVDTDSDGVNDAMDQCPDTNGVADVTGCALSQLDTDNDGVSDAVDQCPGSTLSSNQQGCDAAQVDTDNDGVNDAFDQCKSTSGIANGEGCAAEQRDSDNDGVNDAVDQCPDTALGLVGQDGCAVPETDTDGDGIPDHFDNTPTQCVDVAAFNAVAY